jgi:hypothetical protein
LVGLAARRESRSAGDYPKIGPVSEQFPVQLNLKTRDAKKVAPAFAFRSFARLAILG